MVHILSILAHIVPIDSGIIILNLSSHKLLQSVLLFPGSL